MVRWLLVDRAMGFTIALLLLTGASWAGPIAGPFLWIQESSGCGDRHQAGEIRLLSWPQKAASIPILNANCVAEFSSHLQSRQIGGNLAESEAENRASCHQTPFEEVPSPSGGKSKFCGILCVHGRPMRVCTY